MKSLFLLALFAMTTNALACEGSIPSTEMRFDSRNRPVIATEVNGQGPYYMVVDTGAESSLMQPALAKLLKLESFDSGLTINGATGTIAAKAFPVDSFTSDLFDVSYVGLLAFPNPGSTEAAGVIGMDLFADNTLVFNFDEGKLQVLPSGQLECNYLTIPAIKDESLLLQIKVKMNGVEIPALIDTGAATSIANLSALNALGWQATDTHLSDDGSILGATADERKIKKANINEISLGGISIRDIPIRFTLNDDGQSPALILGSDVLNSLLGFAIDFPQQKLLIKLP